MMGSVLTGLTGSLIGLALVVFQATATTCPSLEIADVLADPVVQTELDRAWIDSDEGTSTEHEEGGYVTQCRALQGDGTFNYETRVHSAAQGDINSLTLPAWPETDDCRVATFYHTHPGVGVNDPGSNDSYLNDRPSGADRRVAVSNRIPGIIRYGLGTTTANVTDITYTGRRGFTATAADRPTWQCLELRGDWTLTQTSATGSIPDLPPMATLTASKPASCYDLDCVHTATSTWGALRLSPQSGNAFASDTLTTSGDCGGQGQVITGFYSVDVTVTATVVGPAHITVDVTLEATATQANPPTGLQCDESATVSASYEGRLTP
jgi:hypothetical protein